VSDARSQHIEALQRGETISLRVFGNSMTPLIHSGDRVQIGPAGPAAFRVGDIVLARVHGTVYLHRISAVDTQKQRVQISNNRGHVNGWTGYAKVYGIFLGIR
jgi:phage repressor protein C with HTH and peptisase S24 domain